MWGFEDKALTHWLLKGHTNYWSNHRLKPKQLSAWLLGEYFLLRKTKFKVQNSSILYFNYFLASRKLSLGFGDSVCWIKKITLFSINIFVLGNTGTITYVCCTTGLFDNALFFYAGIMMEKLRCYAKCINLFQSWDLSKQAAEWMQAVEVLFHYFQSKNYHFETASVQCVRPLHYDRSREWCFCIL